MASFRWMALVVAVMVAALSQGAAGQVIRQPIVSGVALSPEGMISHRAEDTANQLSEMRRRLKMGDGAKAPGELKCVSLPKVFAQAKDLLDAGKPLPEELKYLGGLTRIDYVFVYPEEKDLVIAGPAEEWVGGETLEPTGKVTGRPVMQLFDLIVAMRTVGNLRGGGFFGCSIDLPENAGKIQDDIAKKYGSRPHAEIIQRMKAAMPVQTVRVIGTANDTRVAFTLVAADYKLKRFTMGQEITPVTGLANAVDDSRASGCRFWFEPQYEPLTVSADGNTYRIRGARIQVKAGLQEFDTKGVTEKAKKFATTFNAKLPELVKVQPALADLQNIADLALLAALVRHDGLDQKVGWDTAWCLDAEKCAVPKVPVLKTAETVVAISGNAVASGGVAMSMGGWIGKEGRAVAKGAELPAAPVAIAKNAWQAPMKVAPVGGPVSKP